MTRPVHEVPTTSAGDVAYAIAKASVSSVPIVGSAATELFALLVQAPIEKRRNAWMQSVAERLMELESAGLDLASLRDNEEFTSLLLHASQVALRTHSRLKLDALRSVISKAALEAHPDETMTSLCLGLIDELTPLHIRMLAVLSAPPLPADDQTVTIPEVLGTAIPELQSDHTLMHQINRDLYNRGLLRTPLHPHDKLTALDLKRPRTTEFGQRFLAYIESGAET
jgi:hypothetical protein